MSDKSRQLDQIAQNIIDDNVCPELAKDATQLVFGVGSADADIVFIGEAPGKKEDEQGEPFVGAAGKFLNEMLEGIGLERKDIYITNIVKYRPPNNRDPSPEEKAAFLPYLVRQLEVIDPKLIVTLGRHSMEYFLPGKKISQIHGEPKRIRVKMVAGSRQQAAGEEGNQTEQTATQQRASSDSGGEPVESDKVAKASGDIRLEADARQRRGAQGDAEALRRESTGAVNAAAVQEPSQSEELSSSAGDGGRIVILPLYHPAAALYNGGQRQTLIDDFNQIPKVLELIKQE